MEKSGGIRWTSLSERIAVGGEKGFLVCTL
jgi:hypothetical protein